MSTKRAGWDDAMALARSRFPGKSAQFHEGHAAELLRVHGVAGVAAMRSTPSTRTAPKDEIPTREPLDVKAARNADPAFADAFVVVKAANPLTKSTIALRHLASLHLAKHGDDKVAAQREAVEQLASAERKADESITVDAARERGFERARSLRPELFS